MAANLSDFSGKKIITRGGGCALVCITNKKNGKTYFFYMYLTNSSKPGKRFISTGDKKSPSGVVTTQEWAFAKTWKKENKEPVEVTPLNEEELALASKLAQEIEANNFFGYEEADHITHAQHREEKNEHLVSSK